MVDIADAADTADTADTVDAVMLHVAHAINDAHQRILAHNAVLPSDLATIINTIYARPYAFECACALANNRTVEVWFVIACKHGMWPLIHWLIFVYNAPNVHYGRAAFDAACAGGHESVARWLIDLYQFNAEDAGHILYTASGHGMFRLARHIFNRYESYFREPGVLTIHKIQTLADACEHDCVWFIRWLDRTYGLTLGDVCTRQMGAFAAACENGHWHLARWMALRFGLTRKHIRAAECMPLVVSCSNDQLCVARWLVKYFRLSVRDVRDRDNPTFMLACSSGCLGVAQWLTDEFHLTTRDARGCHNYALTRAARAGHTDIVRWLVERFGLGREGTRVNCSYCVKLVHDTTIHIPTMKWLITVFGRCHRRRHALRWNRILLIAAVDEACVDFAWWTVKRFGITPCDIKPAFDRYVHWAGIMPQNIARAQQWFDAVVAEQ